MEHIFGMDGKLNLLHKSYNFALLIEMMRLSIHFSITLPQWKFDVISSDPFVTYQFGSLIDSKKKYETINMLSLGLGAYLSFDQST